MRASVIELIAEHALPQTRTNVKAGNSLRDIVKARCGYVDTIYAQSVRRANPSRQRIIDTRLITSADLDKVILPACLFTTVDKLSHTVKEKETLHQIALNYTGYAGPLTIERFSEINREKDLRNLRPGQKIWIPYRAKAVDLSFKDSERLANFERQLSELDSRYYSAPKKPGSVRRPETTTVVNNLAACTPRLAVEVSCAEVGEDYPLSTSALKQVFSIYSKLEQIKQHRGVVAIVDTGIAGFSDTDLSDPSTFPETFRREHMNVYRDGEALSIGQSFDERGKTSIEMPNPNEGMDLWYHGTHMAGIVAGRLLPLDIQKDMARRIQISAFNTVGKDPEKPLCEQYGMLRGSVASGAATAVSIDPKDGKIINLALATSGEIPSMAINLHNNKNVLFVMSAGNYDINLDATKIYPASYGVRKRNSLIVGAHDANKQLLPATAKGLTTVDIAAPGCKISSFSGSRLSEKKRNSGTSPASAFVSFTAALIFSQNSYRYPGEEMDADSVRKRILLTANKDIQPIASVRHDASLNAHKAIAVDFDILEEYMDGETKLHFGVLSEESNFIRVCNDSIDLQQLARIDSSTLGDMTSFDVILRGDDDVGLTKKCNQNESVRFATFNSAGILQPYKSYSTKHIKQIIPTPFSSQREQLRKLVAN